MGYHVWGAYAYPVSSLAWGRIPSLPSALVVHAG